MKIVLTDKAHLLPEDVEKIRKLPATIFDTLPTSEDELIDQIKDTEIVVSRYIGINKRVIDSAPKLKHIIAPSAGYNGIDLPYARSKGITVSNCPTHNSQAVAEHAIGLMFAVSRKVCEASISVRQGEWDSSRFKGYELSGKTIGLIGHGNIGGRIGTMAKGIGMKVRWVDINSTKSELDYLLNESDFVCVCVPLKEDTVHIINAERLKQVKKTCILINISRGGTVDLLALKKALEQKRIAGAGLDVFEGEPMAGEKLVKNLEDKEYIGSLKREIVELACLPNVVATPHCAYNTWESARRQGDELLANLLACIAGEPVNVVN